MNTLLFKRGNSHGGKQSEITSQGSSLSSTALPETPGPLDEKDLPRLPTPFARSLSTIPSYEQMKRTNKLPDYHIKIVVVGDGAVGKTCLLISYVQGTFPTDYIPTIFENYVTNIEGPNGQVIELALWDTAGQEEYSRLRPLSYTNADVLMICYSVGSKTSLRNVQDLWFPEVKHFCPSIPIMLVGLKSDLYQADNIADLVDPNAAESLAKCLGAFSHIQCSARLNDNVNEVFETAIHTLLSDSLYVPKVPTHTLKNPFKRNTAKPGTYTSTEDTNISVSKPKRLRKNKCILM
ncbi:rho4p [Saccharomyces arboricola H-6]|uniref:GTP-binding protein RHO4 n=1 Tax=Saccharomyces arboricola (strain H-6 / AS 2.3317 / CBS 10644) TaxID=1160507 RepID=J8Q2I8_SACAR|nr:rho4p [Saccharomyces arboricola H-6]